MNTIPATTPQDDNDPWQSLEADLFGTATPAPESSRAAPRTPEPEPVSAKRETPREEPPRREPVAPPPAPVYAEEAEDDDDSDDNSSDEADDLTDEDSSAEPEEAAEGSKKDAYWDALANWDWNESDGGSSGSPSSEGRSRTGGGGRRDAGRPARSGRSDRGGRSERSDRDRPRGDRPERGGARSRSSTPAHESREPAPPRTESVARSAPVSPAPPPADEDVWDDLGSSLENRSAEKVAPQPAETHPAAGPDGAGDADSQKRRRRRRRGRGGSGRGEGAPQGGAVPSPRASEEFREPAEPESEPAFDDAPEVTPAAPSAAVPAEERDRGRSRNRRSRRGRGDRAEGNRPRPGSRPPAEFVEEDSFGEAAQEIEDNFDTETPPAARREEDVEVIDYSDMPTWEEAISYLLHPERVEIDPQQQTAGAERKAQAHEEGRSGSRHYGRKR